MKRAIGLNKKRICSDMKNCSHTILPKTGGRFFCLLWTQRQKNRPRVLSDMLRAIQMCRELCDAVELKMGIQQVPEEKPGFGEM